ncbi:MAG TPA: hypothetical protein VEH31_40590, partial [Streptosporangiaceae bacterium]|nr:hypothetical protein [Streptosporangiaceae bacterium]
MLAGRSAPDSAADRGPRARQAPVRHKTITATRAASLTSGTSRRCSTGRSPKNTAGSGPGMPGMEYRMPAPSRART